MSKATVPRSQVTSNSQTLRGTGIFPYTTLIHIDPRILPNVGKYASPMECLGILEAQRLMGPRTATCLRSKTLAMRVQ